MEQSSHVKLLDLFKKKGGFFNSNLSIKKDLTNGFSIVAIDEIKPNEELINVPYGLLIPKDSLENLNKFNDKFVELYLKILNDNSKYLDNHPLNCNNFELEKINNTIKGNENLYLNFNKKIEKFNSLNDEKKNLNY